MLIPLTILSPYVQEILSQNHFVPTKVLRYGPRFVCATVDNGDTEGLFKMVLPLEERRAYSSKDYEWTEFDEVAVLEQRLIKEALFLQFFSTEIDNDGFEPQIIALSESTPIWSLRTFIRERTMSAWDSDFVFSPRFFDAFTPRQSIDFFKRIHDVSPNVPESLTRLVTGYTSTLMNTGRYDRTYDRAITMPGFEVAAPRLLQSFHAAKDAYARYNPVITHYEPYPPHIFGSKHRFGLIDWENVGWGHHLQDVSVLYMRCFARPEWQAEYVDVLREYGYFEGDGQLYWDSEMLIQGFANHQYFAEGGPIGTPEYDAAAVAFFERTINDILATSPYFKA